MTDLTPEFTPGSHCWLYWYGLTEDDAITIKHPFSTRRGRRFRAMHLTREPLCRFCRLDGKVTAAATVDHIIEVSKGGAPYDHANCRSLCEDHHKQRHGARPKPDIDPATGLPKGGHWWSET